MRLFECGRTVTVKHPTDGARPHGCRPSDVELEAIGGHESDIWRSGSVAGSHNNAQNVKRRCVERPVRLECIGSGAVGILQERASPLPTRTRVALAGHRISDKARRQHGHHHPLRCSLASMSARSIIHSRGVRGIFSTHPCRTLPRRPALIFLTGSTRAYSEAKRDHDPLPQQNDLSLASAHDSGTSCRGRSVLLTGGTSGIGLAVAEQLVKAGAGRVLILTRDADRGAQTVQHIKASTGLEDAPVSVLAADITNKDDVQGPISQAIKQMVNKTR